MDLIKKKKLLIFSTGLLYFISTWLLTVGFFTPIWIYAEKWLTNESCVMGLIYTWCEQNSAVMQNALIMMSVALSIKYCTACMIGLGIFFDLWKYTMFMTVLSILFGVFYPAAAILVVVSTIYVEAYFTYRGFVAGYSVILCTVAGGMMLLVFIGLVMYDQMYAKEKVTKPKKQLIVSILRHANGRTDTFKQGPSEESKTTLRQYKGKSTGVKTFKRRDTENNLRRS